MVAVGDFTGCSRAPRMIISFSIKSLIPLLLLAGESGPMYVGPDEGEILQNLFVLSSFFPHLPFEHPLPKGEEDIINYFP